MFEFERPAGSLIDAARLSRTRHYWYIYGVNDCAEFDFDYTPVPWQNNFVHVWPSQWHQYGGVYLANKYTAHEEQWHFHNVIVKTKATKDNWQILHPIDLDQFDWAWVPHPKDPPYIYVFGNQHYPAERMPTVEYHVPGATERKFMEMGATLQPDSTNWIVPPEIDSNGVDYTWRPDPGDPPYIYEFATQWQSSGGARYTVPGATKIKYVDIAHCKLNTADTNWQTPHAVEGFDYSWHPANTEEPYIYEFATQWQSNGGPVYHVPGATTRKYVSIQAYRKLDITDTNWQTPHAVKGFDYSWHPDNTEDPYIYEFATQWQPNGGPVYYVPGAIKRKYVDVPAKRLPQMEHWQTPYAVEGFDYSWHPDSTEEPYIYEFATQWQANGGPVYHVPGATKRKFVDIPAKRLPQMEHWTVIEDITDFDYSWHPSTTEEPYIYVFGNQHYPGTIMPTVIYTVPGATKEKFVDVPIARLAETRHNWEILEPINETTWDWTWIPNPKDPSFIYEFGNQWNPAEYKASIRYTVPGATEVKYMEQRTQRLPQPELFEYRLPVAEFDYSWEPNPFDPPMTYIFGNQWNPAVLEPTVVYTVSGATETKYIEDIRATLAHNLTNWKLLDEIERFDYSWRPNPTDPPYCYVFGNQWLSPEQRPALQFEVAGATEIKYMDEPKALRIGNPDRFTTHYDCAFDYSWEPDPGSPPYIYVFGNQWWSAEVMPTVEYTVLGATERKFMSEPIAQLAESPDSWYGLYKCEFDYSWKPDPGSPPYIYVFGNQWYTAEIMPTVEYHMLRATERKYVDYNTAQLLPMMERWTVPEEIDQTNIDFSWSPHPKDQPYIYHFGTEHQMSIGLTYTVPGATELKFEGEIPRVVKEKRAMEVLDIFFIDRNNATAQTRYERLQMKYPKIQKVRYANNMMATIQRCANKAKTGKFWIISSEYSYDTFDFTWHAQPWQSYMTHVFPSQHQKWSDTLLINRWEFDRHSAWAEGLEQFPNLNFVKDQIVTRPENLANIFYVDHGNGTISQHQYEYLRTEHPDIVRTRFVDTYLDTFKRIMAVAETEYVWIINSVCDYTKFDFTWQPEPWQQEMIHCFPSGNQERGDTFYIHVESFKKQMVELELLDWFNVINYSTDQYVDRFPVPRHVYNSDNLVEEIKNYTFTAPYTLFTNQPDIHMNYQFGAQPCLWTKKDRVIQRFSKSGATTLVPRDIKADLRTQIYDYPYIEEAKTQITEYKTSMDIVYISNGEAEADLNWQSLLQFLSHGMKHTNRVVRSDGVNGRIAAYQAAARLSTTPWFFAVFAKLKVDSNFDWNWQPDYFQEPKHYIFNSYNPVNGLEYGHQGMIAYNKKLVLENNTPGIDFTLSQPHESVPILSGIAHFNQSAWMTWRTAFREVVKLKHFIAEQPTLETEHRLNTWLTTANGEYAEYCIKGANDAVKYYNEVGGDYELLKLSFDWAWLQQRFTLDS